MIDIKAQIAHMYDIVGAIYEVHKELGAGLNEYCYQEGFEMQLQEQQVSYQREMTFHPSYHGRPMNAIYRVDFLCKGDIIVECKSVDDLDNNMRAQLFNYMRLLKKQCGVLVNFYPFSADVERYFYDIETNQIIATDGHVIYDYNRRK